MCEACAPDWNDPHRVPSGFDEWKAFIERLDASAFEWGRLQEALEDDALFHSACEAAGMIPQPPTVRAIVQIITWAAGQRRRTFTGVVS